MELGPIFRALAHNKTRFWLITLEVALTLAIVVNCINLMLDLRSHYVRPTGIDESSVILVDMEPFGDAYQEETFIEDLSRRDLAMLRALPGVREAAGTQQIPLAGGGSATARKPVGSELDASTAPYFVVSEGFVEAIGTEIVAGRDLEAADFAFARDENGDIPHRNVVLSQALADVLFPDGDALGKVIQNNGGQVTNTIVGIAGAIPNSWPSWDEGRDRAMLFPGLPGTAREIRYLVGVEPRAVSAVINALEPALLEVDSERLVHVRTLAEQKAMAFSASIGLIKVLTSVIVLLIFVTALGIVGLTAFSVAQRVREIGTRRALGATKTDIVRYFLVENALITSIGLAVGTGLTYGLNIALVNVAGAPKMPWGLVLAGMLVLWGTGLVAALAPALRASRVAPEVATRTV